MTRIIADISVSLDGFVTGPDPGPDNGLGTGLVSTGGEAPHTWAFSDDPDDRRVLREATARSGAVVLGRRLFDVLDGPDGWDDTTGYGTGEVGKPAFVVVTCSPSESVRLTGLDWTFVTAGLSEAVTPARMRAEVVEALHEADQHAPFGARHEPVDGDRVLHARTGGLLACRAARRGGSFIRRVTVVRAVAVGGCGDS